MASPTREEYRRAKDRKFYTRQEFEDYFREPMKAQQEWDKQAHTYRMATITRDAPKHHAGHTPETAAEGGMRSATALSPATAAAEEASDATQHVANISPRTLQFAHCLLGPPPGLEGEQALLPTNDDTEEASSSNMRKDYARCVQVLESIYECVDAHGRMITKIAEDMNAANQVHSETRCGRKRGPSKYGKVSAPCSHKTVRSWMHRW